MVWAYLGDFIPSWQVSFRAVQMKFWGPSAHDPSLALWVPFLSSSRCLGLALICGSGTLALGIVPWGNLWLPILGRIGINPCYLNCPHRSDRTNITQLLTWLCLMFPWASVCSTHFFGLILSLHGTSLDWSVYWAPFHILSCCCIRPQPK